MTDRPDLDRDAERVHERQQDIWATIAACVEEGERRLVLGHFAAAFLHACIVGDLRGLKDRGLSVPAHVGSGTTLRLWSTDKLRQVMCSHGLESGHVTITYFYVERGELSLRLTQELPTHPTNYATLPDAARKRANEIRAFLLHGDLP